MTTIMRLSPRARQEIREMLLTCPVCHQNAETFTTHGCPACNETKRIDPQPREDLEAIAETFRRGLTYSKE